MERTLKQKQKKKKSKHEVGFLVGFGGQTRT